MRILISIPHIFSPKQGSLYSSENELKKEIKMSALLEATHGNLDRNSNINYIHASLGKGQKVITREFKTDNTTIDIMVYTKIGCTLATNLPSRQELQINYLKNIENMKVAEYASIKALEMYYKYDLICYMEDDIAITDIDFFSKLGLMYKNIPSDYALMPHRCEKINGKGFVILSGDPDGGRKDLFWDTGEMFKYKWNDKWVTFYRAINPHSGCYFLGKEQAKRVYNYWKDRNWKSKYQLSGPLEQAASGMLLPVLKIMKPVKEQFKFLMVTHQDELWKRHEFEGEHL